MDHICVIHTIVLPQMPWNSLILLSFPPFSPSIHIFTDRILLHRCNNHGRSELHQYGSYVEYYCGKWRDGRDVDLDLLFLHC